MEYYGPVKGNFKGVYLGGNSADSNFQYVLKKITTPHRLEDGFGVPNSFEQHPYFQFFFILRTGLGFKQFSDPVISIIYYSVIETGERETSSFQC